MIVLGGTLLAPVTALLGIFALPVAAFFGGLATTLCSTASRRGAARPRSPPCCSPASRSPPWPGATGILIFMADDRQLRDLTFWTLGSLAGATWQKVGAVGPIIVLALLGRAVPGARAQRAGARRGDGAAISAFRCSG